LRSSCPSKIPVISKLALVLDIYPSLSLILRYIHCLAFQGAGSISVVDFGDVYISEINAKTKVKTFKLKFKDCAGIPNKKAQIKLTKRATCEGTANDGAGFANGSTAADKASAVAVEVWSTETPATGSATQFSCVTPASQEVTISNAANAVVYYPMSARLVVEKNKTVSNVTAGKFSAPATFTVTYN
ncbi:fimbrial-like protein YadL, partial [Escherichia coli]|uniref:fimbrial-like protein YadL n=1 Tax=Escherichia coli TaxID=562 RepID=UPI001F5BF3AD